MTTSISSGAQKSWMGIRTSRKKEYSLKSSIYLLEKINTKRYLFSMMTDIPKVKVYYILDAQNNRPNFYDTVISKKFKNRTMNTKDIRKYVNIKIAKNLLKSPITMDIFKQLEN